MQHTQNTRSEIFCQIYGGNVEEQKYKQLKAKYPRSVVLGYLGFFLLDFCRIKEVEILSVVTEFSLKKNRIFYLGQAIFVIKILMGM